MQTEQVLRTYLIKVIGEEADNIESEKELAESGILDSFAILDLLIFVEEELKVDISQAAMVGDFEFTLAGISGYITKCQTRGNG